MKKILVTGFEPFGGKTVNPAGEIVKRLQVPEGTKLVKLILPVAYEPAMELLQAAMAEHRPDVVLSFGQSGMVPALTPEKTAVNFATTRSADGTRLGTDEKGTPLDDALLKPGRPAAYFATLPVRDMCLAAQKVGVPARISLSAGSYICNAIMYTALDEAAQHYQETRCDFVHVPYLPEEMPETVPDYPRLYCMELEDMIRGAQAMLDLVAGLDPDPVAMPAPLLRDADLR